MNMLISVDILRGFRKYKDFLEFLMILTFVLLYVLESKIADRYQGLNGKLSCVHVMHRRKPAPTIGDGVRII